MYSGHAPAVSQCIMLVRLLAGQLNDVPDDGADIDDGNTRIVEHRDSFMHISEYIS